MNIKNFEVGILRAYYVVWVLFSCGFGFAVIDEGWDSEHVLFLQYIGLLLAFVVGPGILMFATRWIYRGFVPRTSATNAARRPDQIQAKKSE